VRFPFQTHTLQIHTLMLTINLLQPLCSTGLTDRTTRSAHLWHLPGAEPVIHPPAGGGQRDSYMCASTLQPCIQADHCLALQRARAASGPARAQNIAAQKIPMSSQHWAGPVQRRKQGPARCRRAAGAGDRLAAPWAPTCQPRRGRRCSPGRCLRSACAPAGAQRLAHTAGSFQSARSRHSAVPSVRLVEPIEPLRARPHLYSPVSMTSGASPGSRTGVAVACPCCTRWGCRAALAPASAGPARLVLQRQGGWYAAPAGRTCIVQSTPRRRNSGTVKSMAATVLLGRKWVVPQRKAVRDMSSEDTAQCASTSARRWPDRCFPPGLTLTLIPPFRFAQDSGVRPPRREAPHSPLDTPVDDQAAGAEDRLELALQASSICL